MTDDAYNGWTNYATWGVALVLDNDESTYTHVRDGLAGAARLEALARGADPLYFLAESLQDFTEELCGLEDDEDRLSLMARQILHAGLCEVDWREIARVVLSENDES